MTKRKPIVIPKIWERPHAILKPKTKMTKQRRKSLNARISQFIPSLTRTLTWRADWILASIGVDDNMDTREVLNNWMTNNGWMVHHTTHLDYSFGRYLRNGWFDGSTKKWSK